MDDYGDGFRQSYEKPVKVDGEYDVIIEEVGIKGDGIARVKGFVIFVPNTKKGETVRVKVTRVLRKFAIGESLGAASGPVEADTPPKGAEEAPAEEAAEAPAEEAPTEEAAEAPAEEAPAEKPKKGKGKKAEAKEAPAKEAPAEAAAPEEEIEV